MRVPSCDIRLPAALPGRTPEAEFLRQVGWWFVNSVQARQHHARIRKFKAAGLLTLRRHKTTSGAVVFAYELTDAGLARLAEIAGVDVVNDALTTRSYLRSQANKAGIQDRPTARALRAPPQTPNKGHSGSRTALGGKKRS